MAVLSKVANIAVQPQPVGVVEAFAGSNAPNGWLICDGSQVSRSLYPELFSVIGTTYGSGDGFSTFTLPDLRGRTIAGKDGVNNMNNGPTNRLTSSHFGASGTALGNSGGNEAHTLTTAQLPAHSHGITDPGHTHTVPYNTGPDTLSGPHTGNYDPNTYGAPYTYTTSSRTTGISIQNAGSGNAHNITQPTMILNYIIKAVSELPRGGWYNSSTPDIVTSLPTNPFSNQEVYHLISGSLYHKKYDSSSSVWKPVANDLISDQVTFDKIATSQTNWAQNTPTVTTVNTATPTVIATTTITLRGRGPVLVIGTGDGNPSALNDWNYIAIYINGNQQTPYIVCVGPQASGNNPFAITRMFSGLSAGSNTFTLRAWQGQGTMVYGEVGTVNAPSLVVVELM